LLNRTLKPIEFQREEVPEKSTLKFESPLSAQLKSNISFTVADVEAAVNMRSLDRISRYPTNPAPQYQFSSSESIRGAKNQNIRITVYLPHALNEFVQLDVRQDMIVSSLISLALEFFGF
jgi:hypothetical protein